MIAVNIVFYLFVFIMGITFGSFFTLAVYRIPLRKDITHTRSFCPECNHALSFFDLIPLFSYLFLGGKCRYCRAKIRPRYFLIELFSGIAFILLAIPLKTRILSCDISAIVYFATSLLYMTGIFLIAGIDKEKIQIRNEIILYLVIVETLYIIYLYILEHISVHRYVMYLFVIVLLVIFNNLYFNKKAKNNYALQCVILSIEMSVFTFEACAMLTIIFALLIIAFYELLQKLQQKKFIKTDKTIETKKIPMAYFLSISHCIIFLLINFLSFTKILS